MNSIIYFVIALLLLTVVILLFISDFTKKALAIRKRFPHRLSY